MNALWCNDGSGWVLKGPTGFPDEATLHRLVGETPQLLPLAGAPTLVVLGTEVRCGNGYADIVAVEAGGRPALIEVKLAANAEARRAVVAQLLAYAASLQGLSVEQFQSVLAPHLQRRGFASVADAVASEVQDPSFGAEAFTCSLAESLQSGRFRLAFVLDEAPTELVRLVGYLESITDVLAIDLIVVTPYEIGGARVVVPQRVSPERPASREAGGLKPPEPVEGTRLFRESIQAAAQEYQATLRRMLEWAIELEVRGLAKLDSSTVENRTMLRPWITGHDGGLITLVNESRPGMWPWRSVFEKFAPQSLELLETAIGRPIGPRGNPTLREIDEPLLALLTRAYEEAANRRIG